MNMSVRTHERPLRVVYVQRDEIEPGAANVHLANISERYDIRLSSSERVNLIKVLVELGQ